MTMKMMNFVPVFTFLLLLQCLPTCANVEKTIFIAPAASIIPQDASIDNLLLLSLNPDNLSTRTYINASFPTTEKTKGTETWALLEGLKPRHRYEVRICWLATQPTAFWIYTYTLTEVFETPDLVSSLSTYSYARHAQLSQADIEELRSQRFQTKSTSLESSILFLRIFAAADYFSLNQTLMKNVPPVHADVILDPYIFNIFPQSLVPTSAYLMVIAVIGWFLSGWIYRQLRGFVADEQLEKKKTK